MAQDVPPPPLRSSDNRPGLAPAGGNCQEKVEIVRKKKEKEGKRRKKKEKVEIVRKKKEKVGKSRNCQEKVGKSGIIETLLLGEGKGLMLQKL